MPMQISIPPQHVRSVVDIIYEYILYSSNICIHNHTTPPTHHTHTHTHTPHHHHTHHTTTHTTHHTHHTHTTTHTHTHTTHTHIHNIISQNAIYKYHISVSSCKSTYSCFVIILINFNVFLYDRNQ